MEPNSFNLKMSCLHIQMRPNWVKYVDRKMYVDLLGNNIINTCQKVRVMPHQKPTKNIGSPQVWACVFFNENKTKPLPPSQRYPTYCMGHRNSSIQDSIRSLLKHCGAGKLLGVQRKSFNVPEGNRKDLKRFFPLYSISMSDLQFTTLCSTQKLN